MKISRTTVKLLTPLEEFRSQYKNSPHIGSSYSSNCQKTITHAKFVIDHVLPQLEPVCKKYGQESVTKDIVDLVLPIYTASRKNTTLTDIDENRAWGASAVFLSHTLTSNQEEKDGNISTRLTNQTLAERFGMKYVFGPIVDLGLAHIEHQVFASNTKFFNHHACRMGEVIGNFSHQEYLEYIELAKRLLEHEIYDWSIEHSPEEWGMLSPSIRLYGFRNVLNPIVQAMIDVGWLAGTKDRKYKFSLLHRSIVDLFPIILPKVRKEGVAEIDKIVRPIVDYINDLGKKGKFQNEPDTEAKFFKSFAKDLPLIQEKGIVNYLAQDAMRW